MTDIKTPEMAMGDDDKLTITMSAHMWEGIASVLQCRLFAIHDIAVRASLDASSPPMTTDAEAIRDLCRLSHAALVEAGLLK